MSPQYLMCIYMEGSLYLARMTLIVGPFGAYSG
jgi:hypothetical protein